ncbi:MAG: SOS response-associated peptidase family protein, partial [Candidatus Eremiobacteraeota bacterium]|nr:SOS response-associated peptidase family protein [Candidatus Eremiobacteraeota bacterium]
PQGEKLGSCCLLTTGANPEVAQVHDRMPVVVEPGDYACWLEGEPEQAAALFGPARASLEVYRVSTVVNKAGNDVPECVVRLEM